MKEFCKKYVELEVLAMTYLKELLAAQEKAPKHFRNNIVDWCDGITVDYIEADEDRVFAHYIINQWDCSGAWYLDITDRAGINEKLQEFEIRVNSYEHNLEKSRAEHEAKEKAEFNRLSEKFTIK